ncbi:MAG: FitA-like ribbon-helix-helix domain-containing protein [Thermocrispum sp.]
MATIQVKDLPEEVAETFRRRAAEAGQSLQAFMRQYLIEAARQRTKNDYLKIIEQSLAQSTAPGATAESIDEALREARGE